MSNQSLENQIIQNQSIQDNLVDISRESIYMGFFEVVKYYFLHLLQVYL